VAFLFTFLIQNDENSAEIQELRETRGLSVPDISLSRVSVGRIFKP
jgi:hypothetical protein